MPMINGAPSAHVAIQMQPQPGNASPTPATIPSTPDSGCGDEYPLLHFQAASSADIRAALALSGASASPLELTPDAVASMGRLLETGDRMLGDVIGAMPDLTPAQEQIVDVAATIADGGRPITAPGTPAFAASVDLQAGLQDAEEKKGAPLTSLERRCVVADTLGSMLRSVCSSGNTFHRLTANYLPTVTRTAVIVSLATVLRQVVGHATERLLRMHHADDVTRNIIGLISLAFGPVLLLVGGIRDQVNHTGTITSLASRLSMVAVSIGAAALVWLSGSLPQMASFGMQAISYTLVRDGMQAFVPVQDNSRLTLASTLGGGAVWSGLQILASMAMDAGAPDSGAGFGMREPLHETFQQATETATASLNGTSTLSPAEQESTFQTTVYNTAAMLVPALLAAMPQNILRGVINAVPEVADDFVRQAWSLRSDERLRLRVVPRVPGATNLADQYLTTNAARSAAFANIYGVALGANRLLGDALPQGTQGSFYMALLVSGACFAVYLPLIGVHAQTPPPTSYNMEPAPDPGPVQGVRYRSRTSESEG